MKTKLVLLSLIISCFNIHAASFKGVVRFKQNNKTIAAAVVSIQKEKKKIATCTTNQFGEFTADLLPGKYTFHIQAGNIKSNSFIIDTKKSPYAVFYLQAADPMVISSKDKSMKREREEFRKGVPVMSKSSSVPSSAPISERSVSMAIMHDEVDFKGYSSMAPSVKAGLLTAGEINDFQKWNLWTDMSEGEWSNHRRTWKCNPTNRYTVQLKNSANNPLVDATAILKDSSGRVLWQSKTDNTGKAELWSAFSEGQEITGMPYIDLYYEEKHYQIDDPKTVSDGINFMTLPVSCKYSNDLDIAFVVDATGSMGDEIQYLKEEMRDVIERVQTQDQQLNIHTAAVFYKDHGDDYLTKISDFTTDVNTTQNFIKAQFAGGGGDFPEAVDDALAVSIRELHWSSQSRARLLFLILDAPPHADSPIVQRMNTLIQEAAQKGIRIIPLSSSGIDKSTEYLMRCLALGTNGTYTFLTNHSGIGGHHISPSTDSFKVELINDLLVRIFKQFTFIQDCKYTALNDTNALNQENPFNMYHVTENMKVYPNPTKDKCWIEIPDSSEQICLADLSGKLLEKIDLGDKTKIELSLIQYPTGIYFVRCLKREKWLAEKILLTN